MFLERSSGILLHPTSLPSPWGIGDLGKSAFKFVDFLKASGQKYWQTLPLGPTGFGDSPYQSLSAFAGNSLLIAPDRLVADGLLDSSDASQENFPEKVVEFHKVIEAKSRILEKAFAKFSDDGRSRSEEFIVFCEDNSSWLESYSLFHSLKTANGLRPWFEWDEEFKKRDQTALQDFKNRFADRILFEKFCQFQFFRQWFDLKEYANANGIKIIGDLPIFVAMDSADVWSDPSQFKLNDDLSPRVVAGVPPDFFSKTGQLWGNPIYDWQKMRDEGFRWWVSRVRHTLRTMDIVRIDHFRGFAANYEVPGGKETAENGEWVDVPGSDLFSTLRWVFGGLPMIAEDLGHITPDVVQLRESFGIPGMRVLQFGFGGDTGSRDLPHNYTSDCVAYTGTHDNDTAVGWFGSLASNENDEDSARRNREREFCLSYLNSNGEEINWDLIRSVSASVASLAIFPLQDVLGLGSDARMNYPSTIAGNWSWRFGGAALTERLSARLKDIAGLYGR